jgi:hypothetical protein
MSTVRGSLSDDNLHKKKNGVNIDIFCDEEKPKFDFEQIQK